MSDENYLERIEQLKFDRDKYIEMWCFQCQITEQVMKERDRLTAELAGTSRAWKWRNDR